MSAATEACKAKMEAAKVSPSCIKAFLSQHKVVESGETGCIPETAIESIAQLEQLNALPAADSDDATTLLKETVMLKLNGGLGTGMGLSKAKSLLEVKDGCNFLDFIAKQVLHFRAEYKSELRFMLMNSFSTSEDTKAHMQKYPEFAKKFEEEVELLQNKVPKIRQDNFLPADYSSDPDVEWCPPGHGDLYAALIGSGKLQSLISEGYKYMFVSNSDNLGATLDMRILSHMAKNNLDFIMEVCERTESDKKGGHLARDKASQKLMLRESAQCPKEDEAEFQNITKHKFFNTNNLWINLKSLLAAMEKNNGMLSLPVIRNSKTVNPTDSSSTKVFQLETAMGTAISSFENASAIIVSRERFAPVKTCNDLLSLRSDAYEITPDHRMVLSAARNGKPAVVSLEDKNYKFVHQFEKLVANGAPSMLKCDRLKIVGPVAFSKGVCLEGEVSITNENAEERKSVEAGSVTGSLTL